MPRDGMLDNLGQQFGLLVDQRSIFTLNHDTNQRFSTGGAQQHASFSGQSGVRLPDGSLNRVIFIYIETPDQWHVYHMLRRK